MDAPPQCSVDGCDRTPEWGEVCRRCYYRIWKREARAKLPPRFCTCGSGLELGPRRRTCDECRPKPEPRAPRPPKFCAAGCGTKIRQVSTLCKPCANRLKAASGGRPPRSASYKADTSNAEVPADAAPIPEPKCVPIEFAYETERNGRTYRYNNHGRVVEILRVRPGHLPQTHKDILEQLEVEEEERRLQLIDI